jgi:hypothetical protein
MCKFFQDKHIKVSLFIQDGIQSLDGTIYLNFAQEGVIFSEMPGTVKYGEGRPGKQLPLVHAPHWVPNNFTKRLQGTTQPHLGSNMYAAERVKPPVPLKLEDKDVKKVAAPEDTSVKATASLASSVAEETKKPQTLSKESSYSSSAATEFNQLANLIGLAAEERDKGDDFKLNLFPDTVSDAGGIGSYSYKDSNVIEIDLKQRA